MYRCKLSIPVLRRKLRPQIEKIRLDLGAVVRKVKDNA
jgi:hypothetical protein